MTGVAEPLLQTSLLAEAISYAAGPTTVAGMPLFRLGRRSRLSSIALF